MLDVSTSHVQQLHRSSESNNPDTGAKTLTCCGRGAGAGVLCSGALVEGVCQAALAVARGRPPAGLGVHLRLRRGARRRRESLRRPLGRLRRLLGRGLRRSRSRSCSRRPGSRPGRRPRERRKAVGGQLRRGGRRRRLPRMLLLVLLLCVLRFAATAAAHARRGCGRGLVGGSRPLLCCVLPLHVIHCFVALFDL